MDPSQFRLDVRALVRALGVLDEARTPCGLDLSVREAYALAAIASAESAGQPLSQMELQEQLAVDKSNVTRLVQQLVAREHVEQHAGESDARVRRLHLTVKGRRVARNLDTQSLARFTRVLERIPRAERAGVLRALTVFRDALEQEREER